MISTSADPPPPKVLRSNRGALLCRARPIRDGCREKLMARSLWNVLAGSTTILHRLFPRRLGSRDSTDSRASPLWSDAHSDAIALFDADPTLQRAAQRLHQRRPHLSRDLPDRGLCVAPQELRSVDDRSAICWCHVVADCHGIDLCRTVH